jgi:uncharacterized membrane protein YhaH (DUF805 family)
MDFVTSVKTCLKDKYACFEGRARRSEYWWFVVANAIISIIVGFIPILNWIIALALIVPGISVSVRRLHDTGRSGWWYLLCLVPLVGTIVLIVFDCQDSQPGANAYGPNPKEEA